MKHTVKYFVSADLPKKFKERFRSSAATVPVDKRHMTMLYLGQQASENELVQELGNVAKENKAFTVHPNELGMFGKNKNILVAEGKPSYRFNKLVDSLSEATDVKPQFKQNRPHVTLSYNAPQAAEVSMPKELPVKTISLIKVQDGKYLTVAKKRLKQRNMVDNIVDYIGDKLQ